MSSSVWITIGIIFAIVWIALIWEACTAPIMPDDYDTPFAKDNGSKKKKQYKKGFYNGDTDTWYPDNKV